MKTVGIIGGLVPETTSEFYLDLIFSCQKRDKKNIDLQLIIASVPLPYKIEDEVIVNGTGFEKILPF
jgi:aspartate/glutamate racemase